MLLCMVYHLNITTLTQAILIEVSKEIKHLLFYTIVLMIFVQEWDRFFNCSKVCLNRMQRGRYYSLSITVN